MSVADLTERPVFVPPTPLQQQVRLPPTFIPVVVPPVLQPVLSPVQATATSPTSSKKPRASKPAGPASYYNVPECAGVTPFMRKLKFVMDHPEEFGEAIHWWCVPRQLSSPFRVLADWEVLMTRSREGLRVLILHNSPRLKQDFLPRLFNHGKPDNMYRQCLPYRP